MFNYEKSKDESWWKTLRSAGNTREIQRTITSANLTQTEEAVTSALRRKGTSLALRGWIWKADDGATSNAAGQHHPALLLALVWWALEHPSLSSPVLRYELEFSNRKKLKKHSGKKRCFPFKSFCHFIADFSFISSFSFVLIKQDRWDSTLSQQLLFGTVRKWVFPTCCKTLWLSWPRNWSPVFDLNEDLMAGSN